MIESIVSSIGQRPCGAVLLVSSNFNPELGKPEGNRRKEEIVSAMEASSLKDTTTHFLQNCKAWSQGGKMRCMHRQGQDVRYRMEYILGTYLHMFQNIYVQDTQHNFDHYMVLGYLCGAAQW